MKVILKETRLKIPISNVFIILVSYVFLTNISYAQIEFSKLDQALIEIEKNNFSKAKTILDELIKDEPENSDVQYNYGLVHAYLKQYSTAIKYFVKVLKKDPKNLGIKLDLAHAYSWNKNYSKAHKLFDELIQKQPENVGYLISKARAYYFQGKYHSSRKVLNKAIKIRPNDTDARALLNDVRTEISSLNNDPNTLPRATVATDAGSLAAGDEIVDRYLLSYGVEWSSFDRDNNVFDDWNGYFAQLNYQYSPLIDLYGRIEGSNRFDLSDKYYEVGTNIIPNEDSLLYFKAGFSADNEYLPQYKLSVGGQYKIYKKDEKYNDLWLSVDFEKNKYKETGYESYTFKPGINYYVNDDLNISTKYINVRDIDNLNLHGFSVDGSYQTSIEELEMKSGFAFSPEAEESEEIGVKTIYIGSTYDVSDKSIIYLYYTRDDREESYIKNKISLSVSHRF